MKTSRDNVSLGSAGLAEGTNANTFQIGTAVHYTIAGRAKSKAATDNIAFTNGSFAAHVQQTAKKFCAYFVFVDASGTVTVQQSAQVPNAQATGYKAGAFEWPGDIDGLCCIGAILIDTQNAATFTPGSVDLSATDVVDTYHNVAIDYGVPIRY